LKMIKINLLFFVLLFVMPMLSFSAEEVNAAQQQLWAGAISGDVGVVEKALAAGADINKKNKKGSKALTLAIDYNHPTVVELLLDKGAETKHDSGDTVLIEAAMLGLPEIVEILIKKGLDVNVTSSDGAMTPLMFAVASDIESAESLPAGTPEDFLEVVKLLVKAGANVSAKDNKHNWPVLFYALAGGDQAIVQFLIEAGALSTIKDKVKATDFAARFGWNDLIKLIDDLFRQRLIKKQDGLDPLLMVDITQEPSDKLIILGNEHPYIFLKKAMMDYLISKVGSEEGIVNPFTRKPISKKSQRHLLKYFSLPENLLGPEGPIYNAAKALQLRENLIVMMGEPETEEGRKELDGLKDEVAGFRKQIHDTLVRYNYNYAE